MIEALRLIYRYEGVRGLSSGLGPTLLRDAPYSGLYLMFYTQLKDVTSPSEFNCFPFTAKRISSLVSPLKIVSQRIKRWPLLADVDSPNKSVPIHFACGIAAGVLASVITHPADVVKTKMQLYPSEFKNAYTAFIFVYNKHGLSGYFKGIVPRMLRRTLMTTMAWTVYEQVISIFLYFLSIHRFDTKIHFSLFLLNAVFFLFLLQITRNIGLK